MVYIGSSSGAVVVPLDNISICIRSSDRENSEVCERAEGALLSYWGREVLGGRSCHGPALK